jgi:hypothetical protein
MIPYLGLIYLDNLYINKVDVSTLDVSTHITNADDGLTYDNMSDFNKSIFVTNTFLNNPNYYNYERQYDNSQISYSNILDDAYQLIIQKTLIMSLDAYHRQYHTLINNYKQNNKQQRINKLHLYQRRMHKRY